MAQVQRFYDNTADSDLLKDFQIRESDIFLQKEEFSGTAVYASAGQTFTPATSPSWAIDAYNSTVAANFLVIDDNGVVCSGKITDTTATAITVVIASVLLESDGATAGTFTNASTYTIRIFTPSSIAGATYGPFFGYTEGVEFTHAIETMQFDYSMPQETIRRDVKKVMVSLKAGTVTGLDPDVTVALFGGAAYGLQTSQTQYAFGSRPSLSNFYRVTLAGEDVDGKAVIIRVRRVQFNSNGNIFSKSSGGYLMTPFDGIAVVDAAYPRTANYYTRIRSTV
jgi:hypothetical protein